MTIILVTGVPGAGKTSYAAQNWLAREFGRKIRLEDETCIKLGLDIGTVVERRLVVGGFRGLILENEMLPHALTRNAPSAAEVEKWNRRKVLATEDGKRIEGDEPEHERLPGDPPVEGVPAMAQNWWLWCKPGDFIAIDEAQFSMPRGTLGRKPPYWLQAMEIHRHYGIDFLIITQHPQLIDTTVRALVGHHEHVRSIMGTSLCAVYTWDHASNPERFSMANKKLWKRGPKAYRLYHSSVAHIGAPAGGRGIAVALPLLVLLVGGLTWRFTSSAFSPKTAAPTAQNTPGAPITPGGLLPNTVGSAALPAARQAPSSYAPAPIWNPQRIASCIAYGQVCRCQYADGRDVGMSPEACQASAASRFADLVRWQPQLPPQGTSAYGASPQAGQPMQPITVSAAAVPVAAVR